MNLTFVSQILRFLILVSYRLRQNEQTDNNDHCGERLHLLFLSSPQRAAIWRLLLFVAIWQNFYENFPMAYNLEKLWKAKWQVNLLQKENLDLMHQKRFYHKWSPLKVPLLQIFSFYSTLLRFSFSRNWAHGRK